MSQLISRILLTVLLFPSAGLILFISFIFAERLVFRNEDSAIVLCAALTCAYMIGYWLLLWRRAVTWTTRRWQLTFGASAAALAIGTGLGICIHIAVPYSDSMNVVVGSLSGTVFWMIATVIIWRETRGERGARLARAGAEALVCPSCGYNLTGLHEARCPECGASFTLNDLLASQPRRAQAEVEQV